MLLRDCAPCSGLMNSSNALRPITSTSRLPVTSSQSRLKRCTIPLRSRITTSEFTSDTTCSANASPCARSLATETVSEYAEAVPAQSVVLTFLPTR